MNLLPQDAIGQASTNQGALQLVQDLGYVDYTALGVLAVFCVIGLFKGLIWQVSRIAILVAAYVVAGRFGNELATLLAGTPAGGTVDGGTTASETTIYLAYTLLFVAVLVALSLLAILVQKLARKAGLGFFDRLGGGVVGIATGACVVLFAMFVVHMFFRNSPLANAAEASQSMHWSRRAIDALGDKVPDDLRVVFKLQPLHPPTPGAVQPNPATNPEAPNGPGVAPVTGPRPPVEIPGPGGERK
ncbi:MAG: CvpA family protein [Planctomycetes bacterium]|nr:CvpA family protein [Planctomycetota bacterium]